MHIVNEKAKDLKTFKKYVFQYFLAFIENLASIRGL